MLRTRNLPPLLCGLSRACFQVKYPKAVACIEDDWEVLTAFYSFPAKHWRHLKTTNPIESVFSPLKARLRLTKGAGSERMAEANGPLSCSRRRRIGGTGFAGMMKFPNCCLGIFTKTERSHMLLLTNTGYSPIHNFQEYLGLF